MAEETTNARPVPDDAPEPQPRRSAARWLLLLVVWLIGLCVWAIYIAMLVMLGIYLS